jgi:hypothetical protein
MRFLGLSLLLASLSSCTSFDPAPVYVQMDYQMRCIDCQGSSDHAAHNIKALNGEKDLSLECSVTQQGSARLLSFSLLSGGEGPSYELEVSQLRLDGKGTGDACRVTVEEGGTLYGGKMLGKCTPDEPTMDNPCQIKVDVDGDIIDGTIYCKQLTAAGNTSIWSHLVDPFSSSDPAVFELRNCTGL